MQQFKAIAEAEGGALAELTTTYDAYKTSTDAALAEKEVRVSSLPIDASLPDRFAL